MTPKIMLRRGAVWGAALVLVVALAAWALPAAARGPVASFAPLVERVTPAVVNIRTVRTIQEGPFGFGMGGRQHPGMPKGMPDLHEFFRRFFGGPQGPGMPPRKFKRRALGSGVIVDPKGYVLTNNHVVAGADEIVVVLKGGDELKAKVVGRDKKTDLALLKVQADDDLPYLEFGDSDVLRVGDWVVAVGNPFGLEHTVTAGIVSAKGRIIGAGPYDDFIQTDASINPGNSGGPLIDLDGKVVGINTAIVAQGQGIGFAIPINLARQVMVQLKEHGKVVRGWLGVYIQPVTRELARKFDLDKAKGALVADVVAGGPAEKAGLKRGDVIVEFDGREVKDSHSLPRMVAGTKVGKEVEVKVIRKGRPRTFTVTLGRLKEEREAGGSLPTSEKQRLGMTLQKLTPELAQQLKVPVKEGLVVTAVTPGGPADEAGLRRGDVILEVAQQKVSDLNQFKRLLAKVKPGEGLLLLVQRGENTHFVVIKIPKS